MTQRTQQVECPKCNGRGNISAFAHTANGKCFMCAGVGTVKVDAIRDSEVRRMAKVNHERRHGRYELCGPDIDGGYSHRSDSLQRAVTALKAYRYGIHPSRRSEYHPGEIWDHAEDRLVTRGDVRRAG